MRRLFIFFMSVVQCFIVLIIFNTVNHVIKVRIPYKEIVKKEDIKNYANYIIISETAHTGTGWTIYGNEQGMFEKPYNIIINSEKISIQVNGYLTYYGKLFCIADYIGEEYLIENGEIFEKYEIKDWQFMVPIFKRRLDVLLPLFLYPTTYLSVWDKYDMQLED